MKYYLVVVLAVIWTTCSGVIHTPIAYTPVAVSSLNGSDANGGCPSLCISNTVCNCEGRTEDVSSAALINGVVPTLDLNMRDTWASELFTIKTGSTSYSIGFQFQRPGVVLREVEIHFFFCPAWNIPTNEFPTIVIWRSIVFPSFIRPSGPPLHNVTLNESMWNCNSLTAVFIPVQTTTMYQNYFIEFYGVPNLGRLYIGEVKFSDQSLSVSSTSSPNTSPASTTNITVTSYRSPDDNSSSTMTSVQSTSPNSTDPITSEEVGTSTSSSVTTQDGTIGSTGTSPSSFPVVIVGTLVGVIAILLLLVIAGGVFVVIFTARKKKSDHVQVQQLQDVVLEGSASDKMKSPETEKSNNNNYERTVLHGPRMQSPPGTMTTRPSDGSMNRSQTSYSTLVQPRSKLATPQTSPDGFESKNFFNNDIGVKETQLNTYDTIEYGHKRNDLLNTYKKIDLTPRQQTPAGTPKSTNPRLYSLINKQEPPEVPKKTPELYRALKGQGSIERLQDGSNGTSNYTAMDGPNEEDINQHYVSATEEPGYYSTVDETKKDAAVSGKAFIGKYSEVEGEASPDEVYSEVTEQQQTGYKPAMPPTSPVGDTQGSSNLVYTNPDTNEYSVKIEQRDGKIYTDPTNGIYTNRDAEDSEDDAKTVYDIINEPIQPSMFVGAEGTKDFKDEDIYAPIYDTSGLTNSCIHELPTLQPENIRKVKTIGTGYFGKVILADTVDLSEKDLKLGDSEDKTKSIRVAVKQLKANPSIQAEEAFDKELKFMSRLNHENVIRVLGSCKSSTTYIMMEYMEKGDLNQYLLEFEHVVSDNKEVAGISIQVDTLINMSAKIANGMQYLSSKNFIHRDLATRNCLIGGNLQVKIADFGMSRNLYQSQYYVLKGHAILPIRWMAKECFYGKFSTKTDVWAFGVTMWEMFTLAKDIPYEDMEDQELIEDATHKERRTLLAKPVNCPTDVYNMMLTCWEEKPQNRASFDVIHFSLLSLIKDAGSK